MSTAAVIRVRDVNFRRHNWIIIVDVAEDQSYTTNMSKTLARLLFAGTTVNVLIITISRSTGREFVRPNYFR